MMESTLLRYAPKCNDDADIKAFRRAHNQETPLGWAIRGGRLDRVVELVKKGHDVNELTGFDQGSPLHNVRFLHNEQLAYDIAHALLANGARAHLHVRDLSPSTPFEICSYNGMYRVCQLLLAHGVAQGSNPITSVSQLLVTRGGSPTGVSPTLLRKMLASLGADARSLVLKQSTNNGRCSLHYALNTAVARCLVEYGYDPIRSGVESTWMCPSIFVIRDKAGDTALGAAKRHASVVQAELRASVVDGRGFLGPGYSRQSLEALRDLETYLYSFESLPLIDLETMKASTELNGLQRFLAKRLYFTTLAKVLPLQDLALRVMSFLSPADVMK